MFGDDHYMVDVDTIKNIIDRNGHDHIDLLKMDIEGAEINVLNWMMAYYPGIYWSNMTYY